MSQALEAGKDFSSREGSAQCGSDQPQWGKGRESTLCWTRWEFQMGSREPLKVFIWVVIPEGPVNSQAREDREPSSDLSLQWRVCQQSQPQQLREGGDQSWWAW